MYFLPIEMEYRTVPCYIVHRQKLYREYSLQMKTLKGKLSEDAAEVKKHAKKLAVSVKQLSFQGIHCVSIRSSRASCSKSGGKGRDNLGRQAGWWMW